ncbi:MAG: pyridoxamine 5'-phosphate oxidase family protein [Firmicutes bacterium]|nr:pyridoxamine 5'-phosphate oxidase family protein [Bacillota bacterium]
MSKEFDAIKECGIYFLVTINGDYPAARPFGSLQEIDGKIYFNTTDQNEVHKQLRKDPHVQIVAKKPEGRGWIRMTGLAKECLDPEVKRIMVESSNMKERFEAMGLEHFLVFMFTVEKAEYK